MEFAAEGSISIVFAVTSPVRGFPYSVVWCKETGFRATVNRPR